VSIFVVVNMANVLVMMVQLGCELIGMIPSLDALSPIQWLLLVLFAIVNEQMMGFDGGVCLLLNCFHLESIR
jgi:hypothetical protein